MQWHNLGALPFAFFAKGGVSSNARQLLSHQAHPFAGGPFIARTLRDEWGTPTLRVRTLTPYAHPQAAAYPSISVPSHHQTRMKSELLRILIGSKDHVSPNASDTILPPRAPLSQQPFTRVITSDFSARPSKTQHFTATQFLTVAHRKNVRAEPSASPPLSVENTVKSAFFTKTIG